MVMMMMVMIVSDGDDGDSDGGDDGHGGDDLLSTYHILGCAETFIHISFNFVAPP